MRTNVTTPLRRRPGLIVLLTLTVLFLAIPASRFIFPAQTNAIPELPTLDYQGAIVDAVTLSVIASG